jgi:hypothetical protein
VALGDFDADGKIDAVALVAGADAEATPAPMRRIPPAAGWSRRWVWDTAATGRRAARARHRSCGCAVPSWPRAPDIDRVLLADIDGSGTADLTYLGEGRLSVWSNAPQDAFLPPLLMEGLPRIDQPGGPRHRRRRRPGAGVVRTGRRARPHAPDDAAVFRPDCWSRSAAAWAGSSVSTGAIPPATTAATATALACGTASCPALWRWSTRSRAASRHRTDFHHPLRRVPVASSSPSPLAALAENHDARAHAR